MRISIVLLLTPFIVAGCKPAGGAVGPADPAVRVEAEEFSTARATTDLAAGDATATTVPLSLQPDQQKLKVATFNIENLGKAKRGKPEVMAVLVNIVRKYDIIAIQEIKEASGDTPLAFLNAINAEPGPIYEMVESPRTGTMATSGEQEQYAYYYSTDTVRGLGPGVLYPDPHNEFVREPWIARFGAVNGSFTFVLLDIHTKPTEALREIGALHDATTWAKTQYLDEDDFISLGDFNASCDYASPVELDALEIRGPEYVWIIPDAVKTNLARTKDCAYDRIVTTTGTASDFAGEWAVDKEFDDTNVSDHWPVWAEFYVDEDEPSSCCKTCTHSQACGNSCISATATCTKAPGCACDATQ